jgi:hypothetical protein
MPRDQQQTPGALFGGRWIGATQGCDMPAHVWEITQRGQRITIETRWEDGTRVTRLYGELIPGSPAFKLGDQFTATLVDAQHFIIPGWDTNDARGGDGPSYDVIFSRPGIPELTAHAVWLKNRERLSSAESEGVMQIRDERLELGTPRNCAGRTPQA